MPAEPPVGFHGEASAASLEVARRIAAIALEAATAESEAIGRVAKNVAERLCGGGGLYSFGAGHAQVFAMELCSRAGGLRGVVAMNLDDLRAEPRLAKWRLMDSGPERDPVNGPALLDLHGVSGKDALVIASHSGRNGTSVEMALEARRRGTYVACVTSLEHSRSVGSRHPSGLRLFEVCDEVIDNHCPLGDAVHVLPGGQAVSSASTVSFSLLAQQLNTATVLELLALGEVPEVLVSANVDLSET